MVMSSYLSIVARVLILDQMTFIRVLQELNMPNPFETLMDIWIRKMPVIGQPDKRKLLSEWNQIKFEIIEFTIGFFWFLFRLKVWL